MRAFAVAAVAFATVAVAQNSSKIYGVEDLGPIFGTLSENTKRTWCRGQTNNCINICKKNWTTNDCNTDTLVYSCVCSDGETPPLQEYLDTMPTYICQEVHRACIENHPNDRDGQEECNKAMEASCNTPDLKDPAKVAADDSTTSVTTTADSADSTGEPSTTNSADGSDVTGGAAQTTSTDNFAAPTAAPAAGAAAVAVAMFAYLV